MKYYRYKKGARKSVSHAEEVMGVWEGGTNSFEIPVVLTQELEVIAILKGGGGQNVSTLKGRRKKITLSRGGWAQKVSNPQCSHFVAPPLPLINDQSLRPVLSRKVRSLTAL